MNTSIYLFFLKFKIAQAKGSKTNEHQKKNLPRSTEKDKNQRIKHENEKKKMTNHVLCTWVFSFSFLVQFFGPPFSLQISP